MSGLNGLSPDGKWLAYHTGAPDSFLFPFDFSYQGPNDLALNLLNLETNESKLITPLLSEDFPNNFQQQADIFKKTGIPSELQPVQDILANILYGSFLNGINSLAWSPNGRHLAFAGQMNGLSSDLYVYDMESQSIRQLSSGSEEIQWISWSPSGKGVLHGSTYWVGMGMECRTYIADLDGTSVRYLSEGMRCYPPDDWLDEFTFLENENENGTGNFHLRSINTQTGGIIMYWEGAFGTYAVDTKNGFLLLGAHADTYPFPTNGFKAGLYLIDLNNGRKTKILDGYDWYSQYFGLGDRSIVVLDRPNKDYFLKTDGTLIPIDGRYDSISVAPNQDYWIGIRDKIFVFDANDKLVREIALPKNIVQMDDVVFVTWSPDSSGFYWHYNHWDGPDKKYQLFYYVNLLDGESILVEENWFPMFVGVPRYKWVPAHP